LLDSCICNPFLDLGPRNCRVCFGGFLSIVHYPDGLLLLEKLPVVFIFAVAGHVTSLGKFRGALVVDLEASVGIPAAIHL
jgi:hypothetical protein